MVVAPEVGCGLRTARWASAALALLSCMPSARGAAYYVTVAGLGGSPDYEAEFVKWAGDLDHELRSNGPEAHVVTLSGSEATRARVEQALAQAAAETKPDDAFALLCIGHGTFDGTDYKFNLPGPDVTAAELAAALNRIPAKRQLVVNMTSASGASLTALARKDRIVITATKSGTEKNAPVFARYWVDALRDPAADTDKNGTVSALEAFVYAKRKTAAYFDSEKLLATEHATMSDTANGAPVRDPKIESGQGLLASAFPVIRPQSDAVTSGSPEKQKLVARKEELEAKIDRLKFEKAAMEPNDYKAQLTALLLALARTQAEIDQ